MPISGVFWENKGVCMHRVFNYTKINIAFWFSPSGFDKTYEGDDSTKDYAQFHGGSWE